MILNIIVVFYTQHTQSDCISSCSSCFCSSFYASLFCTPDTPWTAVSPNFTYKREPRPCTNGIVPTRMIVLKLMRQKRAENPGGGGGATTTGPDATPPSYLSKLGGGVQPGVGGGGGPAGGRGRGGGWPGVRGASSQG